MLTVKCEKLKNGGGVQVYHYDGKPFAKFNASLTSCPDYRNKYVTLNCYRYKIEWVRA